MDSKKTNELDVNDQQGPSTLAPDRFENRDDTASFHIDKGNLTGEVITLDVTFGNISCTCAQWAETKYSGNPEKRTEFFLEPASTSLIDADTLFDGENYPIRLLVTGRFYLKEGYPKNYRPAKGSPKPARVFQYREIKIRSLGSSS